MYIQQNLDGFDFVPIVYPFNRADAILISEPNLHAQVQYAREKRIRQAYITALSDYSFLESIEHLEHVNLDVNEGLLQPEVRGISTASNLPEYLYKLSNLLSISVIDRNGFGNDKFSPIDVSRFPVLEEISGEAQYFVQIEHAKCLKSINLSSYPQSDDLSGIPKLRTLDTLSLSFAKIRNLNGLDNQSGLACLYLTHCRRLSDISSIQQAKGTLRALRIQDCNSIEDFSVLAGLDNLELLAISGTGSIDDIQFIRNMPRLKTLILGIKVLDGDLTPCLSLERASCLHSYKHYNLSDKELPKGIFTHGNEDIPAWRRLE